MAVRDRFEIAHSRVATQSGEELAGELQEVLGQKLVALAIGDRHPKSVGRYARGERSVDPETLATLTDLATTVAILRQGMRKESVRTWMLGANPRLRGKAPIEAFHEGRRHQVIGAAQVFIEAQ